MLLVGWMVMACLLLCETSDSLYSTPQAVCYGQCVLQEGLSPSLPSPSLTLSLSIEVKSFYLLQSTASVLDNCLLIYMGYKKSVYRFVGRV